MARIAWFRSFFTTLALALFLSVVKCAEVTVEKDGSSTHKFVRRSPPPQVERKVVFRNFYTTHPVHLWWEGEDGSTVKMGKLMARGGAADVNTFEGHTFFGTLDPEAKQRVVPSEVWKYIIYYFFVELISFIRIRILFFLSSPSCPTKTTISLAPRALTPPSPRCP